ncbi:hypothetical protein [Leptospira weilii]|uniref:hypothetical protein n=1 Tax=Leptospira weilii TaxID=28184 RepID=UPI000560ADEA|nr:hypothetical protein [Leptospira weilii]
MIPEAFETKARGLIDPQILTFKHSGSLTDADVGKPCSITGDMVISLTANGAKFDGIIRSVEKAEVAVQIDGMFNQIPYEGSAPSFGPDTLVANTNGKLIKDSAGKRYLILSVDTANKLVTFIKD